MITVLIATFILLGLVILAMAIGVLFSREPIKGSCGGLNKLGMKDNCEICGNDPNKCDEKKSSLKST